LFDTSEVFSIKDAWGYKREDSSSGIYKEASFKREILLGNHFWARGYFMSTVGIDEEIFKRYVRHQEKEEKRREDDNQNYKLF